MMDGLTPFEQVEAQIDALLAQGAPDPMAQADALLADGEALLETWLRAKGKTPTDATVEGFRLLALHRQGAKGDPSFNACRETCRELVYQRNLIATLTDDLPEAQRQLRLQAMVLRHLGLFLGGKLVESGLGDFCCSSRPLHGAQHTPGAPDHGAQR